MTTLFINYNVISFNTVLTILRSFSFNIPNSLMTISNSIFNFTLTKITSSIYSNRFSEKIEIKRKNNDILIRVTIYFIIKLELVKRRILNYIKNKILNN